MDKDEFVKRYHELAHAVQSGVAVMMNYDPSDIEPKHLRVGVNMAMCDQGALVTLLIKKGIITEEEWMSNELEMLEQEVKRYEKKISEYTGSANIRLR